MTENEAIPRRRFFLIKMDAVMTNLNLKHKITNLHLTLLLGKIFYEFILFFIRYGLFLFL